METHQLMNLAYLGLLGAAIGGSYIVANRGNMGQMAQQAAIWALIFVGVIGAYGMWGQVSQTISPQQTVTDNFEITVPRGPDGHYYMALDVNGTAVTFVIDTGATQIVLSQEDAERIGIDTDDLVFSGAANTANGVVRTAPVTLDQIAWGPLMDRRVPAVVNGGPMEGSLLGMTYLDAFSTIEIRNQEMILTR